MTASPLIAAIEAVAEAHRAAGMGKREQLRTMVAIYIDFDRAMQARLVALTDEVSVEYDNERQAWADVRSARQSETMRRRAS